MNRRNWMSFGLAWGMLLSCTIARAETVALADAAWTRQHGELVLAQGQLAFAACGEAAAPAVDATVASELPGLVRERHQGRDGAVFVEVNARRDGEGHWQLGRVHRVYRHGPRCLEDMANLVWSGRDAAGQWRLEVTPWRVKLTEHGRDLPWSYRYKPFVAAGEGRYQFAGSSADGAINIVMSPIACAIADERTDFTVEITLAGRRLQGCAYNGAPRSP